MSEKINKHALQSKTFWFGLLTALSPLLPGVAEFMAENSAMVASVWGLAAVVLRFLTKDKIVLKD